MSERRILEVFDELNADHDDASLEWLCTMTADMCECEYVDVIDALARRGEETTRNTE